ncbi:hypothetical protein [Nonlabens sp.]|uniref:hypothetical protein n=1 Tax=Nonlabens sp. TaxID=1888209 RepID=UPI003F69E345
MKKLVLIITLAVLTSCDDGDFIVEDLNFENSTVQVCDIPVNEDVSEYLFYIINDTDFETIALALNTTDDILTEQRIHGPYSLGNNNLEYRKLSGAAGSTYYCNDVPPASPTTTQAFIGEAGNVMIGTTIIEEDNDGISAIDEGINLLDLSLSRDTDGDGLPDYKDEDDDGDNVLTINEGVNLTDLTLSLNTDSNSPNGDTIPDYLDPDDDGDGILTIQEDIDGILGPASDIIGSTPNYLNAAATFTANPAIDRYIQHNFTNTATLEITIEDLTITSDSREIIFAVYEFGTYVRTLNVRVTPTF